MREFVYEPQPLHWCLENRYPSFKRSFVQAQIMEIGREFPAHHVSRANEFGLDLRLLVQSKQVNSRVLHASLDRPIRSYNCWGFVAAMKEWCQELFWMDCNEMDRYLNQHLHRVPVKPYEAQPGDAAVYRAWNCLQHTALCLGNNMLIHKPGPLPLETVSFEELDERHGYCYGPLTYIGRENANEKPELAKDGTKIVALTASGLERGES